MVKAANSTENLLFPSHNVVDTVSLKKIILVYLYCFFFSFHVNYQILLGYPVYIRWAGLRFRPSIHSQGFRRWLGAIGDIEIPQRERLPRSNVFATSYNPAMPEPIIHISLFGGTYLLENLYYQMLHSLGKFLKPNIVRIKISNIQHYGAFEQHT